MRIRSSGTPTRRAVALLVAIALPGFVGACRGGDPGDRPVDAPAELAGPGELFRDLEARLQSGGALDMDFDIAAEGAAEIRVDGRLRITPDGSVDLEATGTFGGQPVALMLVADADSMRFGSSAAPVSAPRPPALREAVVVGLTRMGLLHNLARLTGDAPPDHGAGGVTDWVQVGGFADGDMDGVARSVEFDITVAGVPAGAATLGLSTDGEPVERRQTVAFPTGEMRVVERYRAVAPGG